LCLAFMIPDPRPAPATPRGRRIYSIAVGLLGALLIAPMVSEYWAKVALLAALTIVCAARPIVILVREALERRTQERVPRLANPARRRSQAGLLAAVGVASFAALIVAAGTPARSVAGLSGSALAIVPVMIEHTPNVVSITPQTGRQIAGDAIANLKLVQTALRTRDATRAATAAGGSYLSGLEAQIAKAAGKPIIVPSYRVTSVDLRLLQAVDQAPPTVVATLPGQMTPLTSRPGRSTPQKGRATPFEHIWDLALTRGRFLIVDEGAATAQSTAPEAQPSYSSLPKGVGAFRKLRLVNVAPKLGLDFRQGAF